MGSLQGLQCDKFSSDVQMGESILLDAWIGFVTEFVMVWLMSMVIQYSS